ncbi:hypothetical protein BDA99DRAFT_533102 [Phascolomyces articulosus]|uniref:Uncharacterized protein n=1 Tax=Phascolomyces articulosus TaxID=60185 RepID=A0AAD5PJT7_9FUNG|nr:hypothetical protein BDA99DRAFT_533102 [Phascolomyces articulosus]
MIDLSITSIYNNSDHSEDRYTRGGNHNSDNEKICTTSISPLPMDGKGAWIVTVCTAIISLPLSISFSWFSSDLFTFTVTCCDYDHVEKQLYMSSLFMWLYVVKLMVIFAGNYLDLIKDKNIKVLCILPMGTY